MLKDAKLLDILACPVCKGRLKFISLSNELICRFDKLAFPVKNGIPVLIEEEARKIEE